MTAIVFALAGLAAIVLVATPGAGAARAMSVSTGDRHTCAVKEDGTAECWGISEYGQLGNGDALGPEICTQNPPTPGSPNDDWPCSKSPLVVDIGSGAQMVAAGSEFTCALKDGGGVSCWGRNNFGQLGIGLTTGPEACTTAFGDYPCKTTPSDVIGIDNAVSIAAGGNHACALIEGGAVKCWGANNRGQLGLGDDNGPQQCPDNNLPFHSPDCSSLPVDALLNARAVAGAPTVEAVSAGGNNTCALMSDGTIRCWGYGRAGRLGDGTADEQSHAPTEVTGISTAKAVSTGASHSCAVLDDGTVKCWGENSFGYLGIGAGVSPDDCGVIACATTPVTVPGLSAVEGISEIEDNHTCVFNAEVKCWGINSGGQLGYEPNTGPEQCGGNACSATPIVVDDLPKIVQMAAGNRHTCVMTELREVRCWGYNWWGSIGNGEGGGGLNTIVYDPTTSLGFEGGTPTPSPAPPFNGVWGDFNCSGAADPVDALGGLRYDAGLAVSQQGDCPDLGEMVQVDGLTVTFADVDCSGDFSPVDPLKILRADAGLSVSKAAGCPDIGDEVEL